MALEGADGLWRCGWGTYPRVLGVFGEASEKGPKDYRALWIQEPGDPQGHLGGAEGCPRPLGPGTPRTVRRPPKDRCPRVKLIAHRRTKPHMQIRLVIQIVLLCIAHVLKFVSLCMYSGCMLF